MVLSCQLWGIVLLFGARLPTHPKLLDRVVSGALFWTGVVIECNNSHRRSVAVSGVTRYTLFIELYTCAVCANAGYTRCIGHSSVYLCLSSLQNLDRSRLTFIPSLHLCRTILVTPYSMVWDWGIIRAVTMFFLFALAGRSLFIFYYFPFLFFNYLGWDCMAGFFGLIGC